MNYDEALTYIHSVDWKGSRPGLSRITELCSLLENPQKDLRFIHVAGTNGKGSFCRMLSGILTSAGYRTGLFTSPFVERFNERIMLDNIEIPDYELARATETVRRFADSMQDPPTEFELITAIAFVYFKTVGCDYVVLECGMGGRLDSTNVIEDPILSVVTGIALDHTAYLGDTIEKIAAEKGGIIKEGRPCLYGGTDRAAEAVLSEIAATRHAPFYTVDHDLLQVRKTGLDGTVLDFGKWKSVHLPLLGAYQPRNTANVLTAVDILRKQGLKLSDEAVLRGIADTRWKARFELLSRDPVVLYDGGHNPEGVAAAAESIRACVGAKVNLLMGVMADKDYETMVHTLSPLAARVFTVTPANPRALKASELAARFETHGVPAASFATVPEGLAAALADSRTNGLPLVCLGSLYLYAELVAAYRQRTK